MLFRSVREWAGIVIDSAKSASSIAESSLLDSLIHVERVGSKFKNIRGLAFRFDPYGVFVHYGVGRGYVRENGIVKRGFRAVSNSIIYNKLYNDGYSTADLRKKKYVTSSQEIKRNPVDFIDRYIDENIDALAKLAQDFYGDLAYKDVLQKFDKIKINRTNG